MDRNCYMCDEHFIHDKQNPAEYNKCRHFNNSYCKDKEGLFDSYFCNIVCWSFIYCSEKCKENFFKLMSRKNMYIRKCLICDQVHSYNVETKRKFCLDCFNKLKKNNNLLDRFLNGSNSKENNNYGCIICGLFSDSCLNNTDFRFCEHCFKYLKKSELHKKILKSFN